MELILERTAPTRDTRTGGFLRWISIPDGDHADQHPAVWYREFAPDGIFAVADTEEPRCKACIHRSQLKLHRRHAAVDVSEPHRPAVEIIEAELDLVIG